MKRTTISLPDELVEAIEHYRNEQGARLPVSAMIQAAVREYLARRGYSSDTENVAFSITPAGHGSGARDVSAEHDRYFAELTTNE